MELWRKCGGDSPSCQQLDSNGKVETKRRHEDPQRFLSPSFYPRNLACQVRDPFHRSGTRVARARGCGTSPRACRVDLDVPQIFTSPGRRRGDQDSSHRYIEMQHSTISNNIHPSRKSTSRLRHLSLCHLNPLSLQSPPCSQTASTGRHSQGRGC